MVVATTGAIDTRTPVIGATEATDAIETSHGIEARRATVATETAIAARVVTEEVGATAGIEGTGAATVVTALIEATAGATAGATAATAWIEATVAEIATWIATAIASVANIILATARSSASAVNTAVTSRRDWKVALSRSRRARVPRGTIKATVLFRGRPIATAPGHPIVAE